MAYVARSVGDPEKFYEVVIDTTNPWPASEDEYETRRARAWDLLAATANTDGYIGWGREAHPCAVGPVFGSKADALAFAATVQPEGAEDVVDYRVHLGGLSPDLQEQFDRSEESV